MAVFRVLIVCTANLCRSPMAERLLVQAVADLPGFDSEWLIESAGVRARSGLPMHELANAALELHGARDDVFRSRRLEPALLARADLVLTAERTHRADVVRMLPAAIRRTFTLRQFARLLSTVDSLAMDEPLGAGVGLLAAARTAQTAVQPAAAADDAIADPIGGTSETFRECAETIRTAVLQVLAPLRQQL